MNMMPNLFLKLTARTLHIQGITVKIYNNPHSTELFKRNIAKSIEKLPTCLKNRKVKLHIYMNDTYKYIEDKSSVAGSFWETLNCVTVNGDYNAKTFMHILLHEYGHYFDTFTNREFSNTYIFANIHKQEVSRCANKHCCKQFDKIREYFAESFADYLMDPVALQKEAPDTYGYMHQLLHDYL